MKINVNTDLARLLHIPPVNLPRLTSKEKVELAAAPPQMRLSELLSAATAANRYASSLVQEADALREQAASLHQQAEAIANAKTRALQVIGLQVAEITVHTDLARRLHVPADLPRLTAEGKVELSTEAADVLLNELLSAATAANEYASSLVREAEAVSEKIAILNKRAQELVNGAARVLQVIELQEELMTFNAVATALEAGWQPPTVGKFWLSPSTTSDRGNGREYRASAAEVCWHTGRHPFTRVFQELKGKTMPASLVNIAQR